MKVLIFFFWKKWICRKDKIISTYNMVGRNQLCGKNVATYYFLFLLHFWPCLEAMLSMIHVCDTLTEPWKPVKSRRSAVGCLLCQAATPVCVWCRDPLLKYPVSLGAFNHLGLLTRAAYWENTSHPVEWLGTLSEVTCRNQTSARRAVWGPCLPNLVV